MPLKENGDQFLLITIFFLIAGYNNRYRQRSLSLSLNIAQKLLAHNYNLRQQTE